MIYFQQQYSQQNGLTDQWQSNLETLERTKYQLYLILHTVKFQKDKNHNNVSDCTRSLCRTMKEMLNHVIDDFQNEQTNSSQQAKLQASMVSSTKDWHNTVTHELRNHLIDKLKQAILPTSDQDTTFDERMQNFTAFAQKTEGNMYETANSKTDYYHLLAKSIYDIQKDLKERRRKRKAEEMEQMDYVAMVGNQSGVTSVFNIQHDSNQQDSLTCMQLEQQVRENLYDFIFLFLKMLHNFF